jgi:hypothetical protein
MVCTIRFVNWAAGLFRTASPSTLVAIHMRASPVLSMLCNPIRQSADIRIP